MLFLGRGAEISSISNSHFLIPTGMEQRNIGPSIFPTRKGFLSLGEQIGGALNNAVTATLSPRY